MTEFLTWCQNSALSHFVKGAPWRYPTLEILHISGLVLVFGSILVLNLRIFGRVLRKQPVSTVAGSVSPITFFGVGAQFVSGPVLFMATATHFYKSGAFRLKLVLLVVALAYHFGVHRGLALKPVTPARALRISATVSMILWSGVVFAGLAIELLPQ